MVSRRRPANKSTLTFAGAQEALREDATIARLAACYDVDPNLIANWKKKARPTVLAGFLGTQERDEVSREADLGQNQLLRWVDG